MRKIMRKIEVKIRYIVWAYKRLSFPTTYDKINYQGDEGYCINGVNSPMWLTSLSNQRIHESKFLVIRSVKRDIIVFKEHYLFQLRYWYSIDNRNKLFTRISYYNSNNIKFQ